MNRLNTSSNDSASMPSQSSDSEDVLYVICQNLERTKDYVRVSGDDEWKIFMSKVF